MSRPSPAVDGTGKTPLPGVAAALIEAERKRMMDQISDQREPAQEAQQPTLNKIAVGLGSDLRIFLPERLRERFKDGALAKVERIGRGELVVKVWPGKKGKAARPHNATDRVGEVGFWLGLNTSKVTGDIGVIEPFRATSAASVADDGRQLKITLPGGREPPLRAPPPNALKVVATGLITGVGAGDAPPTTPNNALAEAVATINAAHAAWGGIMSIILRKEGGIRVEFLGTLE